MTRKKKIAREVNGLTKSGRGRRICILDSDWRFDGCELLAVGDSDSTNETFSEDASYGIYDSAFEDSSTSYDSAESSSECSDDECLPQSGNRIVNLRMLSSALDVAATCKQCVANDWLSFLDFCEAKKKEVDLAVAKKKTYKEKFMLLNGSTDVRAWYKEWMSLHMRHDRMPMLTLHDVTYGLATDLNIECSTCNGHFPPINSKKSEREHETKSDLCKNEINV